MIEKEEKTQKRKDAEAQRRKVKCDVRRIRGFPIISAPWRLGDLALSSSWTEHAGV